MEREHERSAGWEDTGRKDIYRQIYAFIFVYLHALAPKEKAREREEKKLFPIYY